MSIEDELMRLCEVLEEELSNVNKKVDKSGGALSGDDISYIDKLTHSIKSIKTTMAMMDADDGYSRDYGTQYMPSNRKYMGYSNARGRYARRDAMGRYSRGAEEMIEQVRDLMDKAPDEQTRHDLQRIMERIDK